MVYMMKKQLESLIDEAIASASACKAARAEINGKTVEAMVVRQFRVTTTRKVQKPSIRWSVNGKRVAAANLEAEVAS